MVRPRSSFSPRVLLLTYLVPFLGIATLAVLLTVFVHRLRRTAEWVRHSQEVITQALRVEKLAVDMETGLRGFQISGDARFLEPYDEAGAVIDAEIDALKTLTSDNTLQLERVAHIGEAFVHWTRFAGQVLQRAKSSEDVNGLELNTRGKAFMDDFRLAIGWFIEQEDALQELRRADLSRLRQSAAFCRISMLVIAGLGLAAYSLNALQRRFPPPELPSPLAESPKP